MAYVNRLQVNYGTGYEQQAVDCFDENGASLGPADGNISKGMNSGSGHIYLEPIFVADVGRAATGFRTWATDEAIDRLSDLAGGAGHQHRYLGSTSGAAPIQWVGLLRSANSQSKVPSNLPQFEYMSSDINAGRSGTHLYIMWGPKAVKEFGE